jgi:large subunit ribosomal protein L10
MPMRKEQKEAIVEELAEQLGKNSVLLLTDFTGMDVETAAEIRERFRGASVTYRVVKNTLARRALKKIGRDALIEHLSGPNGVVMAESDPTEAAKIIVEFEKKKDTPKVGAGWVDAGVMTAADIRRIAALPSREQLLAQIAAGFQAPVSGLARLLHELTRQLVSTLDEVAKKKAAESGA